MQSELRSVAVSTTNNHGNMERTNINEIVSLQQAYSLQERLNSEMAVAQSKLREAVGRIENKYREEAAAAGIDFEDKEFLMWISLHPEYESEANCLWLDKKELEEYSAMLDERIEEMEYAN